MPSHNPTDDELIAHLDALLQFPDKPQNLLVVSITRSACAQCGANIDDNTRVTRCSSCGVTFDAVALLAWTNPRHGLHQTLPHVWPEPFTEYISALLLTWHRPIEPFEFEFVVANN